MGEVTPLVARVVRAVVLASTTFAFAVAAHAWGGGSAPSGVGLLALAALTLAATSAVARYAARARWLVPFLALMHLGLHHALSALSGASLAAGGPQSVVGPPGLVATPRLAGHEGHLATLDPAPLVAAGSEHAHGAGPGMLAAHAVAVLATALVLAAAERAAGLALAIWAHVVVVLLGVFRPASRPRPRLAPQAQPAGTSSARAARTVAPRRGPPALSPTVA
ncbi:hypothetical protein [Oerskovia turbata]